MQRTFGLQTFTGSAQPLFGDVMTAAMILPTPNGVGTITVANNLIYEPGDRILLDPGAADQDIVLVQQRVPGSSTKLYVISESNLKLSPHANATVIALSIPVADVVVQAGASNSGAAYIGKDNTVTNTGTGNAIWDLTSNTPYRATYAGGWNTVRTSDFWIAGAAADKFIASADQV